MKQGWTCVQEQGFWKVEQMTFFDVRVFNPAAKRYVN